MNVNFKLNDFGGTVTALKLISAILLLFASALATIFVLEGAEIAWWIIVLGYLLSLVLFVLGFLGMEADDIKEKAERDAKNLQECNGFRDLLISQYGYELAPEVKVIVQETVETAAIDVDVTIFDGGLTTRFSESSAMISETNPYYRTVRYGKYLIVTYADKRPAEIYRKLPKVL